MATRKTDLKKMVLSVGVHVRQEDGVSTVFLPAGTVVGDYVDQVHESRLVDPSEKDEKPAEASKPAPKKTSSSTRQKKETASKPEYDFGTE